MIFVAFCPITDPGIQLYVYVAVPPVATPDAEPSEPPLQVVGSEEVETLSGAVG